MLLHDVSVRHVVGRRVVALATSSYAEFVKAPAHGLVSLPDSVSFELAAAVPVQGLAQASEAYRRWSRRYAPGALPPQRLKARLNEASLWYPMASATAFIGSSLSRRSWAAFVIRHLTRYSKGGSPTSALKRAAKPDRERATAVARLSTVHGSAGRS